MRGWKIGERDFIGVDGDREMEGSSLGHCKCQKGVTIQDQQCLGSTNSIVHFD